MSCLEPVRSLTYGKFGVDFFEACVEDVRRSSREVVCRSRVGGEQFRLNYDHLVIGVGSKSNTFGLPGVGKHAHFLKDVDDAQKIRKGVINNFERAAIPTCSEEDRKRLLTFVVVGGGPTGVETAAEFADLIREDMSKYFPNLKAQIKLIEVNNKVLGMFSPKVTQYTKELFQKKGIQLIFNSAVTQITHNTITYKHTLTPNKSEEMGYGLVLWASGVGPVPLTERLISEVDEQKGGRELKVDEFLRVKGAENIYAFGDCARICPAPLYVNRRSLAAEAKQSPLGLSCDWLSQNRHTLQLKYPQMAESVLDEKLVFEDEKEFGDYLKKIDEAYRAPAPTAQNARQAGQYLAEVFNKGRDSAFVAKWGGTLAYVGDNKAVGTFPFGDMLGSFYSYLCWRIVYMQMQLTWRSRTICVFDWIRTKLAGRDVGRDH